MYGDSSQLQEETKVEQAKLLLLYSLSVSFLSSEITLASSYPRENETGLYPKDGLISLSPKGSVCWQPWCRICGNPSTFTCTRFEKAKLGPSLCVILNEARVAGGSPREASIPKSMN